MPELPEVEIFKRYIDSTSLNKKIKNITIFDDRILKNINKNKLLESMRLKEIKQTFRHGKYLFLKLDRNGWLILHFGMTGDIKHFDLIKDRPRYSKLLIEFENKHFLAFENQRLFGRVSYTSDPNIFIEKLKLGPDALTVKHEVFISQINAKKARIKTTLMNQRNIAGIGNIYADEILFQTRIHPEKPIYKINDKKIDIIFLKMKEILKTAIDEKVIFENYPKNYLIPNRKKEGKCPLDQKELKTIKLNGRTTYFCPYHQKR